jgi:hypothetical protein
LGAAGKRAGVVIPVLVTLLLFVEAPVVAWPEAVVNVPVALGGGGGEIVELVAVPPAVPAPAFPAGAANAETDPKTTTSTVT